MKEGGAVAVATPSSSCRLLYKAVPGNPPLTPTRSTGYANESGVRVFVCIHCCSLGLSEKKNN